MPDRSLYYDRKGRPMTLHDWAMAFEETGQRIVATKILHPHADKQVVIATVWVGVDRSFSANPSAKPLIFETVIFGGPLDGEVVYYSTLDEARAGHEKLIQAHRRMRLRPVLKCWMFFRHSIPTLRESMLHPRSSATARTAAILWALVGLFSVVNLFQSLFVGENYPWAPFNGVMTVCILSMMVWALRGDRWAQGQIAARAKLQAEREAFERMMDG